MSKVKCVECGDELLIEELPENREPTPIAHPQECWVCFVRHADTDRHDDPEEHEKFIEKQIAIREERKKQKEGTLQ